MRCTSDIFPSTQQERGKWVLASYSRPLNTVTVYMSKPRLCFNILYDGEGRGEGGGLKQRAEGAVQRATPRPRNPCRSCRP